MAANARELSLMTSYSYLDGDIIFQQGDASERAFLIESGQVELVEDHPAHPCRIALLNPGSIFGETGFVESKPRSMTARAVGAASILAIDHDDLESLLLSNPEPCVEFVRALFEHCRTLDAGDVKIENGAAAITRNGGPATITVFPLTDKASEVVPAKGLPVTHLPFRVGREPFKTNQSNANELVLPDEQPYMVSRNHLALAQLHEKY